MDFRIEVLPAAFDALKFIVFTCLLSGCATTATQTGEADTHVLRETISQTNACTAAVDKDTAFAPLYAHIPLNDIDTATLTQMSSGDYAAPSEITLLSEYRARIVPCRQMVVDGLSAISPSVADPYTKLFNGEDAAAVALAQQKITWGQFVSVVKEMNDLTRQAARDALANVDDELRQEDAQEREQRSEQLQAFANYLQRQEAINAMNRPVMTNCNSVGTQTACVSN